MAAGQSSQKSEKHPKEGVLFYCYYGSRINSDRQQDTKPKIHTKTFVRLSVLCMGNKKYISWSFLD